MQAGFLRTVHIAVCQDRLPNLIPAIGCGQSYMQVIRRLNAHHKEEISWKLVATSSVAAVAPQVLHASNERLQTKCGVMRR